jgi:Zn-dependent protease
MIVAYIKINASRGILERMADTITRLITVIILIMSVVVHEVSHGYAALWFKDRTAELAGRLTLNPLKHIDIIGSIIVPGILLISGSPFPFGWAKPVPYNENNLSDKRWGTLAVASAGIIANFLLAIVFGLVFRLGVGLGLANDGFVYIVSIIILTNIGLGFFNLIPVPPLDGSKILFALLPQKWLGVRKTLENNGFVLVLILVVILWRFDFISPLMSMLYTVLTGVRL